MNRHPLPASILAAVAVLTTITVAAGAPDRAPDPADPGPPAKPSELFREDRPPAPEPPKPRPTRIKHAPAAPRGPTRTPPAPGPSAPAVAPRPIGAAAAAPRRHPIPDPGDRDRALELLRDLFSDEYRAADTSADATKELANELHRQSHAMRRRTTPDDVASRYVLLNEIIGLSVAIRDYVSAIRAARDLSDHYDIDGPALKSDLVARAVREVTDPGRVEPVLREVFIVCDDFVAAGDLPGAAALMTHADTLARRSRDLALATEAQRRRRDVRELQAQYRNLADSVEKLRAAPDDPAANLAVGRFRCFVAGDFATGLPLLARSADAQLRALAERDLGGAASPDARVELAESWWALAEQQAGRPQQNLRARAAHWYRQALPALGGLRRTQAEKRIAAAPAPPPGADLPAAPDQAPRPPIVITGTPPGGAAPPAGTTADDAPRPDPGPAQPGDRLLQLLATKLPPDARPVPGGEVRTNTTRAEQWLKANVPPGTAVAAAVKIQHGGGLQRHPNTKIPYVYVTFTVPTPVDHDGIQHQLNIAAKLEGQKALDAVTIPQGQRGDLTGTVTDVRLGGWSGNKERGLGSITFLMMLDNVRFTPADE